jgi:hypothetical protein
MRGPRYGYVCTNRHISRLACDRMGDDDGSSSLARVTMMGPLACSGDGEGTPASVEVRKALGYMPDTASRPAATSSRPKRPAADP